MTPQAVLVCLFLGVVIGWVAARFSHPIPERDHLTPHGFGPPPSNVRLIPAPFDQAKESA